MAADLFTKHFINKDKFEHVCRLVGIVQPKIWKRFKITPTTVPNTTVVKQKVSTKVEPLKPKSTVEPNSKIRKVPATVAILPQNVPRLPACVARPAGVYDDPGQC